MWSGEEDGGVSEHSELCLCLKQYRNEAFQVFREILYTDLYITAKVGQVRGTIVLDLRFQSGHLLTGFHKSILTYLAALNEK